MLTLLTAAAIPIAAYASSTLLPWRGLFDGTTRSIWRTPLPGVALTFDDGPDPEWTPRILDVLAERGVRATFFLVGERVRRSPEIVRRIAREGHALGNHSFSHRTLAWKSDACVADELVRTQEIILDACGISAAWLRPPFGRRDATFYRVAARLDLIPVYWSLDSLDWTRAGASFVASRIARATPGEIVLLHDRASSSFDKPTMVRDTISRLAARGRTLTHLNEMTTSAKKC